MYIEEFEFMNIDLFDISFWLYCFKGIYVCLLVYDMGKIMGSGVYLIVL